MKPKGKKDILTVKLVKAPKKEQPSTDQEKNDNYPNNTVLNIQPNFSFTADLDDPVVKQECDENPDDWTRRADYLLKSYQKIKQEPLDLEDENVDVEADPGQSLDDANNNLDKNRNITDSKNDEGAVKGGSEREEERVKEEGGERQKRSCTEQTSFSNYLDDDEDDETQDENEDEDYIQDMDEGEEESKVKGTKESKRATCPECGFVSPNRGELSKHRRKHSDDKPYCCPVEGCDFRTRYPGNIKHHMPSHRSDRPYPCDQCELQFKTKSQLSTHSLVHSEVKPHKCEQCDFRCKRRWELKMHKLKHSDDRSFECEVCKHKTKTLSDLNKHKAKHVDERNFKCPICDKAFKDNRSLRKHVRYTHMGGEPVKCEMCSKTFRNKINLRNHMRLHKGHYPFKCDVCDMRFANGHNKKTHMLVHSGDRPFSCPVCPYAGKTELDVRAHIGVMHKKDRIYKCDVCDLGFSKERGLVQHYGTDKHKRNLNNPNEGPAKPVWPLKNAEKPSAKGRKPTKTKRKRQPAKKKAVASDTNAEVVPVGPILEVVHEPVGEANGRTATFLQVVKEEPMDTEPDQSLGSLIVIQPAVEVPTDQNENVIADDTVIKQEPTSPEHELVQYVFLPPDGASLPAAPPDGTTAEQEDAGGSGSSPGRRTVPPTEQEEIGPLNLSNKIVHNNAQEEGPLDLSNKSRRSDEASIQPRIPSDETSPSDRRHLLQIVQYPLNHEEPESHISHSPPNCVQDHISNNNNYKQVTEKSTLPTGNESTSYEVEIKQEPVWN